MNPQPLDRCRFVETDLADTCKRFDELIATQRCLHINKTSTRAGLEVYAVMDSNCFHAPSGQRPCVKAHTPLLRLIARSANQRNTLPMHFTAQFESHDAQLLEFDRGRIEQGRSIAKPGRTVAVAPMYAKVGGADLNTDHVKVVFRRGDALARVAVEVKICAWKGRDGKRYRDRVFLSVAVPPRAAVEESDPATVTSGTVAREKPKQQQTVRVSDDSPIQVFVSHCRRDLSFARRLIEDLNGRVENLKCWIDELELQPSDPFPEKIAAALRSADYVVVVLSEAAVRSRWVLAELNTALERNLSGDSTTVVPVVIESCDIPELLRSRIYADFRESYESGLNQLVKVFHP